MPPVLYVDNGHVLTSAGAAAALDLCLYMVRQDYGSAVAADTARLSVMPLERAGGQAQFIVHEPPVPSGTTLRPLLNWMEENLGEQLDITTIAAKATMSTRHAQPPASRNRSVQRRCSGSITRGSAKRNFCSRLPTTRSNVLRDKSDSMPSPRSANAFRDLVGTSPQRYRTQFRTSR